MSRGERILFLGPGDSKVLAWLRSFEKDEVLHTSGRIGAAFIRENAVTFLVSHGYRHILSNGVLSAVSGRAVNLHISYLPWNRGADPNFWSFVEGTPKGVSIHYMDEGVDTGDIIARRLVAFAAEGETLATTYRKLQDEILDLFKLHWPAVKRGDCPRIPQRGKGSFHRSRDKERLAFLLTRGWDTPVSVLEEFGAGRACCFDLYADKP